MNDVSVIDRFLEVFGLYIDTGFGLLGGEVAFLTMTLVVIDMTLAGLFWAMGGEDVSAKLIRKTLYVGAFAFIIGNFNALAKIVFNSFAGLGLLASGSGLSQAEFLQPGRLAAIGVDAGGPLLEQISSLSGFPEVFSNLHSILVLFLAWLVVIVSFFFLAIQLFVTLVEFKLTTLAGFVLVPFALWNKTAFLAEKVLGNVVASGIKVLVLAVIVGIGSGLFAEFQAMPDEPSIDHALVVMLASLALLGLGIFGPGIPPGWSPAHRNWVLVQQPVLHSARWAWLLVLLQSPQVSGARYWPAHVWHPVQHAWQWAALALWQELLPALQRMAPQQLPILQPPQPNSPTGPGACSAGNNSHRPPARSPTPFVVAMAVVHHLGRRSATHRIRKGGRRCDSHVHGCATATLPNLSPLIRPRHRPGTCAWAAAWRRHATGDWWPSVAWVWRC